MEEGEGSEASLPKGTSKGAEFKGTWGSWGERQDSQGQPKYSPLIFAQVVLLF